MKTITPYFLAAAAVTIVSAAGPAPADVFTMSRGQLDAVTAGRHVEIVPDGAPPGPSAGDEPLGAIAGGVPPVVVAGDERPASVAGDEQPEAIAAGRLDAAPAVESSRDSCSSAAGMCRSKSVAGMADVDIDVDIESVKSHTIVRTFVIDDRTFTLLFTRPDVPEPGWFTFSFTQPDVLSPGLAVPVPDDRRQQPLD